jgi:hypothetical protein
MEIMHLPVKTINDLTASSNKLEKIPWTTTTFCHVITSRALLKSTSFQSKTCKTNSTLLALLCGTGSSKYYVISYRNVWRLSFSNSKRHREARLVFALGLFARQTVYILKQCITSITRQSIKKHSKYTLSVGVCALGYKKPVKNEVLKHKNWYKI